jgi:hypothetical protein
MGQTAGKSALARGLSAIVATALAIALVQMLVAASAFAATANIIAPSDPHDPQPDSGWQAGTCNAEPPEPGASTCSVATPDQFFERAAAHPNWGFTQFIVAHENVELLPGQPGEKPIGELETVRVDLPVGLSVNPGATGRCPLEVFESGASNCEAFNAKVGESAVTASAPPLWTPIAPIPGVTKVAVYNIVPPQGEPARFGLELAGNEVFLKADVAYDSDYHEGFSIAVPKALPIELAPLVEGAILKNRLFFNGRAGDGTFITTPSTCLGEAFTQSGSVYSTYLLAASYQEEAQPGYTFPQSAEPRLESPIPPGTSPKECATIPYAPTLAVNPNTVDVNSPSGATVGVEVPHITGAGNQDSSDTKTAQVSLPQGMGLNPAAASGLQTCSNAQFGEGTKNDTACPAASKIGTVEITSPPLPEGSLSGDVFVGEQLSRDPTSGNEYRIFVDAESARYGIKVRLTGHVSANPVTGQLTTTFAETPQVPFTSFVLRFDGGAHAVLSSSPTCGPNTATAAMAPWSGNPPASPSGPFTLTSLPGGGDCPKSMAERPFSPGFSLKPDSDKAGAYSPLRLHLTRSDGQQELKGADLLLPPGMVAKLAGIPYCSEPAIAAAAANAGRAEVGASSCPGESLVGSATVSAGTGPSPLQIQGKVFLSGPYHGAPLSLAVVTPATAGPFDLGTAVVRVALFLEPETAQVHAVSDPIPDVFGGAQLSIRAIDLNLDRKSFTLNPTSCSPLATTGTVKGGGADPSNPAAFGSFGVNVPFQTSECQKLTFRPKLFTRLFGKRKSTRRAQHPKFRATLVAREGDANIARAALTLPHSEFLEQSHIRTICTRVQLAAAACPKASIYGYARAKTPLLDDELAGPVYLVSSSHELPDMLVDLRGQVDVRLRGVISAVAGRIKTVFSAVPDVPVSKFVLTMKGGKKGLLVNSRNLCAAPAFSHLNFKAQNGKKLGKKRLPLRVPACKKKRR